MRNCIFAVIAAATLVGSASASADEGTPGIDAQDWSGPYVGIQLGWGWGDNEANEIETATGNLNDGPLPYDADGFIAGGLLGFNFQHDVWVFGLEGDAEFSDVDGVWDWNNGNSLLKEIDFLASVRGRAGYAMDHLLLYATGGLAIGHVEMTAFEGAPPVNTISDDETALGYTVGGGLDYAISDWMTAGVEYRYTDLGETEHSGFIFGDDFTYTHTNEFHAVRARFTYRFGL